MSSSPWRYKYPLIPRATPPNPKPCLPSAHCIFAAPALPNLFLPLPSAIPAGHRAPMPDAAGAAAPLRWQDGVEAGLRRRVLEKMYVLLNSP